MQRNGALFEECSATKRIFTQISVNEPFIPLAETLKSRLRVLVEMNHHLETLSSLQSNHAYNLSLNYSPCL